MLALCACGVLAAGFSWPRKADAVYVDGLKSWRTIGRDGAACASCHGPDGLELALFNFDDSTIRRRAAAHVGTFDAERIVALIHYNRERFRIQPRDFLVDRPFQPGGKILPGATPQERDAAFGNELQERLPEFFGAPIETLAQAKAANAAMMRLDPWSLPIGIPFNRLSEDGFHGSDHASIAAWLPDVMRVLPEDSKVEFFAAEDLYLEDPSDDRLLAVLDAVDHHTKAKDPTIASYLSYEKFRSTLLLQHLERRRLIGLDAGPHPPVTLGETALKYTPNPMWQVGDAMRRQTSGGLEAMGFGPDVLHKKSGGPSGDEQTREARLPWLWLGWLFDQGLQRSLSDPQATSGKYLTTTLVNDGPYPVHLAFFTARKLAVLNSEPQAWGSPLPRHFVLDLSAMFASAFSPTALPAKPEDRQVYDRFVANFFRENLLLFTDAVRTSGEVWVRDSARAHVNGMADFLYRVDPKNRKLDEALIADALDAIETSKQRIR